MFFGHENDLLRVLEEKKHLGDDYDIHDVLVNLNNYFREKKDRNNLIKFSEERHAQHLAQEHPQQVLLYLVPDTFMPWTDIGAMDRLNPRKQARIFLHPVALFENRNHQPYGHRKTCTENRVFKLLVIQTFDSTNF